MSANAKNFEALPVRGNAGKTEKSRLHYVFSDRSLARKVTPPFSRIRMQSIEKERE
jgi:hypothetical protein